MASTLDSVRDPVATILSDPGKILQQLEDDPALKSDGGDRSPGVDTEAIFKRETELTRELREFTALKTVPALILEFRTNLELLEFENCFYSLQTLRRKLRDNSAIIGQSYGLQRSVATYVDKMHLDLVDALHSVLVDGFWTIGDDSITFKERIECGKEGIAVDYNDFMASLETLYFPQGYLDPKSWIISDMILGTMQESVRAHLSAILKDYVKLTGVISLIKSCIFARGSQAYLEDGKRTLKVKQISNKGDDRVKEVLSSFMNVVSFIAETAVLRDRKILAEGLGTLISIELIKFIKANAPIVFRPENAQMRGECQEISLKLKGLSRDSESWNYNGSELERLFGNSEIPTSLQVDKILQDQITELRTFFATQNWRTLASVEMVEPINSSLRKDSSSSKRLSLSSKKSATDDWAWEEDGEDNGWDEQIDLGSEGHNTDTDIQSRKSKRETASETADDAWDEDWDVDIDEEAERISKTATSTSSSSKVTQLPSKIIQLIDNFRSRCKAIDHSEIDEHEYNYKLNVLETSIMVMAERHFKDNWWQLYLDMNHVLQKDPSLLRLQELTHNYLELYVKSREAIIYKLVCGQLDRLAENEKEPSWDIAVNQLVPFIQTEILNPLLLIGKSDSERCLTNFLSFLYTDCIVGNILQYKIISERNSENLSKFISIVYSKTEITALNGQTSYREEREKFAIIGKLLPLHLKEIMEMFYNGDFYLFTTDELVQWILLLFAETPLRRNAIDDIYEIRNANVDG